MCISSPLSPHVCVRRIVIATCHPSPFRCRRSCSWTAPWPTRTITCTLTWRRMRPTWCSPRRRLACPWPRWRRSLLQRRRWWPQPPPPRTATRTRASRTWDWRPKSTRRRSGCDTPGRARTAPTHNTRTLFILSLWRTLQNKGLFMTWTTQTVKPNWSLSRTQVATRTNRKRKRLSKIKLVPNMW